MSHAALKENESDTGFAPVSSIDDIDRLARAFENCTLPPSEFTHSAHLTVALWYLYHYSGKEAATRIREGIKRYNAANGGASTPEGGYHETITMFWIFVIGKYLLLEDARLSLVELASRLTAKYSDKRLLFEYYSRERLFSIEARAGWVEPDLKPLG
jgi:hypothetical protein